MTKSLKAFIKSFVYTAVEQYFDSNFIDIIQLRYCKLKKSDAYKLLFLGKEVREPANESQLEGETKAGAAAEEEEAAVVMEEVEAAAAPNEKKKDEMWQEKMLNKVQQLQRKSPFA